MALLPQAWLSLHNIEGIRKWRRGAEIPPRSLVRTFASNIIAARHHKPRLLCHGSPLGFPSPSPTIVSQNAHMHPTTLKAKTTSETKNQNL